jgi:AAA ATPase domain
MTTLTPSRLRPRMSAAAPEALRADRFGLAAPVFVGRDRELAGLAGLLADASAGLPAVALIEGGAGMGKSALVAEFLARSAASGLAVVVEDLQWADARSARALLFAPRRLADHRVLVVLSARPHGLRHLGENWARFLISGRSCTRMVLTGLDIPELTRLADALGRGRLSCRALRRIADYSRGNPLCGGALLAELPDRILDGPGGGWVGGGWVGRASPGRGGVGPDWVRRGWWRVSRWRPGWSRWGCPAARPRPGCI